MVSAGICSVPLSVVLSTMQVSGITLHGLRPPLSCMASLRNLHHAGSAQSARDFVACKTRHKRIQITERPESLTVQCLPADDDDSDDDKDSSANRCNGSTAAQRLKQSDATRTADLHSSARLNAIGSSQQPPCSSHPSANNQQESAGRQRRQ